MPKAVNTSKTALVIVDKFAITSDVSIQSGKVYFTQLDATNTYELVDNPVVADIADYYEIDASGTAGVARVACIKDYPDMGGTPEAIETTTLCDEMQTFIEGIKSNEQLAFTINYDGHLYAQLKSMENADKKYGIYFGGMDGVDGKFTFNGTLSVSVVGKGVNDVREATITITPSSEIEFSI